MTLLPSSTEGLMGLREEQLVSSTPLKGLDFEDKSPPFYSNGGGPLIHSTAHHMRDVTPNPWWEP